MPGLDVSDALMEVELQDCFTVERRKETITTKGRSQTALQTFRQQGCVYAATPNDLRRLPDEQHMMKTIVVVTEFRLQGPSPGFQADVVDWNGNRYLVRDVEDFSGFGQGFVSAICTSMDFVDEPPHEQQ